MSAYRVIDKLELVVREGLWLPFGWRAVNSERILDLVEKLRGTLPDDAARARRSGDAVERDASEARAAAPSAIPVGAPDPEAMARAQARADALVAEAQAAARDIRRGADEYADQVLSSLDASLGKALAAVQKGRQTLASSVVSGNGRTAREMSAS